jgi:hypothetical protein
MQLSCLFLGCWEWTVGAIARDSLVKRRIMNKRVLYDEAGLFDCQWSTHSATALHLGQPIRAQIRTDYAKHRLGCKACGGVIIFVEGFWAGSQVRRVYSYKMRGCH